MAITGVRRLPIAGGSGSSGDFSASYASACAVLESEPSSPLGWTRQSDPHHGHNGRHVDRWLDYATQQYKTLPLWKGVIAWAALALVVALILV